MALASRPIKFSGLGLGLETSGLGLGLEAFGLGLGLGLGLETPGLVNIPAPLPSLPLRLEV